MTTISIIFALFSVKYVLVWCQGLNISPPDWTRMTFSQGSTAKLQWTYNCSEYCRVLRRWWYFTSSDGGQRERLATIYGDDEPHILNSSLPEVAVEKPATLILKNVDLRYNGTYQFYHFGLFHPYSAAKILVFIAVRPTVTVNCSSCMTVNEDDDITCVCKGQGGNPPANVTWYKDCIQVGETGKEEQILIQRNIGEAGSGMYTCVAQSHTNMTDEKSINVKINFKPKTTSIALTPEPAILNGPVIVTCKSHGLPEPSYIILHNDSKVISNEKTYVISKVNWNDSGSYQCIAKNKLGNESQTYFLTVEGGTEFEPSEIADEKTPRTLEIWHIVVSLVSGIIIGILVAYIAWCSHRRWYTNRKPEHHEQSPEQPAEAQSTYQELDLSKMNTEDNYQSLTGNVSRIDDAVNNDDDSTYTQLNKIRDAENNYQSLQARPKYT